MKFVYGIAFDGDRFVMVYHPRRKGWEMPGGAIEKDETPTDAMVREFREEVGHEFVPIASRQLGEGVVFVGRVEKGPGRGEMQWRCFEHLPKELSFPEVEYEDLVRWARTQMAQNAERSTLK